ncbi:M15 family metallopeptidase [uncultured Cellulomonas sp.]|uniref:M15 family metallopeptidase n=1 Tax=uncultured Cellulomonas sp. TaxID=189682 RepID=UPI00260981EE|nr:M15 family metallopeptidase [uncultured Cellulomonas sp.]
MGPQRAQAPVVPQSRRARREAELSTRKAARPVTGRWVIRGGVLAALAGTTIVLPLTDNVQPGNGTYVANAAVAAAVAVDLPSTVEALTSTTVDVVPPSAIAASTVPVARSAFSAASRSQAREPLPGCDGSARPSGANGQLDTDDLCLLWNGEDQLRADAASALAEMNVAFRARFGRDMCVTDGYRTLTEQRIIKRKKGGLAAVPGRSNHGWGLAIDLCPADTRGDAWEWITGNGAVYGWENPAWAQKGGSGPFEPWHWEYTRGVIESGEYYSS